MPNHVSYQQPTSSGAHRRHRDGHEEREADGGHEDVGVGRQERPGLADDRGAVTERVADSDHDAVAEEEPEAGETDPAMGGGQPVDAQHLVEPGAARHEHQLDERQVGTEEAGDLAETGEDAAGRADLVQAAVADPHGQDQDAKADQHGRHVQRSDRPDARPSQAPRRPTTAAVDGAAGRRRAGGPGAGRWRGQCCSWG